MSGRSPLRGLSALIIGAVIVAGLCVGVESPRAAAATAAPCDIDNPAGCSVTVGAGGSTVHGWLAVRGREEEAATSVREGGCAACVWLVMQECIVSSGKAGPGGEHCAGLYVNCPGTEERFEVLYAPAASSLLVQVDSYCLGVADGGVVDAATLAPDLRRYAGALTVPAPTMRAWPPGGMTLVNLPTYFAGAGGQSRAQTFGGAGFAVTLQAQPQSYDWYFGDGATLISAAGGGAPPGGGVVHTYARAGTAVAHVLIAYGARYWVQTPQGLIGPDAVPGAPIRTTAATLELSVSEAFAGLVG